MTAGTGAATITHREAKAWKAAGVPHRRVQPVRGGGVHRWGNDGGEYSTHQLRADSLVESTSGAALLWRLRENEHHDGATRDGVVDTGAPLPVHLPNFGA